MSLTAAAMLAVQYKALDLGLEMHEKEFKCISMKPMLTNIGSKEPKRKHRVKISKLINIASMYPSRCMVKP